MMPQQANDIGTLQQHADSMFQQLLSGNVAGPAPQVFAQGTLGMYRTNLTPEQEQQFQSWVAQNNIPFEDDGPRSTYDMRGFWSAMQSGDPRAQQSLNPFDNRMHFPDIWKTPYHPTVSNESMYAPANAPHWAGDDATGWRLVDDSGRVVFDETPR